jgi:phosphoglucomutase
VNVPKLITAFYAEAPDPAVPAQRVSFGTSGHRGCPLAKTFNEAHILAIAQAICDYRRSAGTSGPLFLGRDTHALSEPAFANALEVLAANEVEVMIAGTEEYTPTPAISHAILTYNRRLWRTSRRLRRASRRRTGLSDGIVITPSHNPPDNGGFKYNPPSGGPAEPAVSDWIEARANDLLKRNLKAVRRIPFERALRAPTTHRHDYLTSYVEDLSRVIDMDAVRRGRISLGVDPLGGASLHYWHRIAERYGLDLTVVNEALDPTFRFMTVDWDGKIRMDPSSPYVMRRVTRLREKFDIVLACDPDADRHGIVARSAGLLPPNHYLAVAIHYLFGKNRPRWRSDAAVGKTMVSSRMIDRVAAKLGRRLYEVPVGFKWFVEGLLSGALGFGGEESAGASFLRLDGTVWTTDKDGPIPCLLAAEMTARTGRDPGELYRALTRELGDPVYDRVDAPATPEQKRLLAKLSPQEIHLRQLAGEKVESIQTHAPGNGAALEGVRVSAKSGWFAVRPSGTEAVYKIYAESFRGPRHLQRLLAEARAMVNRAAAPSRR